MTETRTTVKIDDELLEWVKDNFPPGSLWWLINALLRTFKQEIGAENPNQIAIRKSVKSIIREIENALPAPAGEVAKIQEPEAGGTEGNG